MFETKEAESKVGVRNVCLSKDLTLSLKHARQMRRHCRVMHEREAEAADTEWHRLCWPCDRYFASEREFYEVCFRYSG